MAFRQAFRAAGRVAKATGAASSAPASLSYVSDAAVPALGAAFARGFAAEAAAAPSVANGKVTQVRSIELAIFLGVRGR